jgi:hypothetical protein
MHLTDEDRCEAERLVRRNLGLLPSARIDLLERKLRKRKAEDLEDEPVRQLEHSTR